MKTIDRLIIKAKKKCGSADLMFSLGTVLPADGGKWEARGQLWNCIPCDEPGHRSETVTYICDSVDDAVSALEELAEKYPNNIIDVPILILDYGDGD